MILGLAIVAYTIFYSYPLFLTGWAFWLPFTLWSLPLLQIRSTTPRCLPLLAIALFCTFIGVIGSFNHLKYFGLAVALVAYLPWRFSHLLWLAAAIIWMPAFDWLVMSRL